MNFYRILALVIPAVGVCLCTAFIVRYWTRSRGSWRKTEFGQFFMLFYINLDSLFILLTVGQLLPAETRRWVGLALYISFMVLAGWPNRLLDLAYKEVTAKESGKRG